MSFSSPYQFGQLRDVATGIMLRFATRDELIASIMARDDGNQVPIEAVVDGVTYKCTVHYQQ